MPILVVAATELELNVVKKRLANVANVDFAVTGVGVLATAYELTKLLAQKKYDWVLNVGIAGTFSDKIALGEVVVVEKEIVGDSGVENAAGVVQPLPQELQGNVKLICPYVNDFSFLQEIKKVGGITVSLLTENASRVNARKLVADVETMEGAAFFYDCLREKVKFLQLRGISNIVGDRNKANWKIQEAMDGVGDLLKDVVDELCK